MGYGNYINYVLEFGNYVSFVMEPGNYVNLFLGIWKFYTVLEHKIILTIYWNETSYLLY